MKRTRAAIHAVLAARGGLPAMLQTTFAQGAIMGVNILTGIITARLLGPTGRGDFAAASFWLLLPASLATAGLQNAIIYRVRQRPEQTCGITAAGLAISTAIFVPLGLACFWLLPAVMREYPPDIVALGRIALLLSIANVWMVIARQFLLAARRFAFFNALASGVALTYLLLLLLLMPLHAVTPATATYAQIGSTGLGLLVVLWAFAAFSRGLQKQQIILHLRALVSYGLRASPIDIVTVMSQNIDRLLLVGLIPAAEFGRYVVALSFARILSVLQTGVSAVMLADLAHKSPGEIAAFTRTCFRAVLWILIIACASVLLIDRALLQLVYGRGFGAAVPVFRILLADAALTCLGQVLIQAFLARNASGVASTIQVLSFAATATGVVVLVPILGSIGAACALTVGSLLRLGLLLAALRRIDIALPGIMPQHSDFDPLRRRLRRSAATSHP